MSLFSSVAGTQLSLTRCVGEQEVPRKIKTLTALNYLTTLHHAKYLINSLRRKGHNSSTRGDQTPTVQLTSCPISVQLFYRPALSPFPAIRFIISNLVWPVLPLMVTGGTAAFGPRS